MSPAYLARLGNGGSGTNSINGGSGSIVVTQASHSSTNNENSANNSFHIPDDSSFSAPHHQQARWMSPAMPHYHQQQHQHRGSFSTTGENHSLSPAVVAPSVDDANDSDEEIAFEQQQQYQEQHQEPGQHEQPSDSVNSRTMSRAAQLLNLEGFDAVSPTNSDATSAHTITALINPSN
ncbi:hypothetical protein GQ42DRAFT_51161 [Ramicandelaber brevisporus]|nr:hypothetical protein GQ42DRAFT_51161 [Ramicandelaber brevisporus]